jgi:hypothetical protein
MSLKLEICTPMIKSLPGDVLRLPTLGYMTYAAVRSAVHGATSSEPGAGFMPEFSRIMADTPNLKAYNTILNSNVLTKDLGARFNQWYKERFIAKYGKEAYDEDHKVPAYRTDENNNILIETDREGKTIFRNRELDPKVVNDLLELSYSDLTGTEKSVNFFASIAPFTIGARFVRTFGDERLLKKIDELIETDSNYAGLSRADALELYRNRRSWTETTFRKLWQSVTFTSDKTRLKEGENVADHVNVMNNYAENIAEKIDEIDVDTKKLTTLETNFRNKKIWKNKAEKEKARIEINRVKEDIKTNQSLLALNKRNRRTYMLKNGNGRYLNPYILSVGADDVIISSAMGYGPTLLGFLEQGTGMNLGGTRLQEMLLGITSPLTAPIIAKYSVRGASALLNATSAGYVESTKRALENSWIPLINPGILVTNDKAKFTKIIEEFNIAAGKPKDAAAPTARQLENFELVSKIFQNLRPEYRELSYQALLRYNDVMTGFEKSFRKLGMSEDKIANNLNTLNLKFAEVTGLAPLIAYGNKVGMDYTATDAVKYIDDLTAISLSHENKLNSIDLLLDTVAQSVKKETGIDIDSNEELQNMFNFVSTMVNRQRNILTKRKAMLREQLDTFVNTVSNNKEIDADTIDNIVNLNELLGGRPLSIKEKADLVNKTYNGLMDSANKTLDDITLFSGEVSEKQLKLQVRRVADVMFDLELGRRRALGSRYYKDVDNYAQANNIKLDMTSLLTKYMDTVDEFKGKPIEKIFGRGSIFFQTMGSPIQKTFESMATFALEKTYKNRSMVEKLRKTYESRDLLPENSTDLDLALFLRSEQMKKIKAGTLDPEKAKMIDFFDATPKQAEDIMRYFKDRALRLAKQGKESKKGLTLTAQEITAQHIKIIDDIFKKADPSGTLLELQENARKKYSVLIGEQTDKGLYVPDVIASRAGIRKKRETIVREREGNYKYKGINVMRPETPFYNIAEYAERFVYAKASKRGTEADDMLLKIQREKDRIFSFLGASRKKDAEGVEQYAFDLREPRQEKILQMAEKLMNTIVTKQLSSALKDTAENVANKVKASQGRKIVDLDSITPENYNFTNAINIIELEKKLYIPVINKNGQTINMPLFSADKIPGYTVDITQHMKKSKKAREAFDDIVDEINNTKGALHIEAKGRLDAEELDLNNLSQITNYVKQPKRFFEEHFQNATAESIERLVEDLVTKSKGLSDKKGLFTEKRIRDSLKYMYLKGIFERANVQVTGVDIFRKAGDPAADVARSEMKDVVSFTNTILGKANREVAEAVLGIDSEHMSLLTNMAQWISYAGGNPRGFAPRGDTKGLTIDNIFSRVFNIARGMVSPLYVGTEIATRMLLEKNQSLLTVALRDKNAARLMAKIIKNPEGFSKKDINNFAQTIKVYVTMAVIQGKGGTPTLNEFMGLDDQEIFMKEKGALEGTRLSTKFTTEGVN